MKSTALRPLDRGGPLGRYTREWIAPAPCREGMSTKRGAVHAMESNRGVVEWVSEVVPQADVASCDGTSLPASQEASPIVHRVRGEMRGDAAQERRDGGRLEDDVIEPCRELPSLVSCQCAPQRALQHAAFAQQPERRQLNLVADKRSELERRATRCPMWP